MNLLALATPFFLVFDPFGNVAIFHTILERLPEPRRRPVLVPVAVQMFLDGLADYQASFRP